MFQGKPESDLHRGIHIRVKHLSELWCYLFKGVLRNASCPVPGKLGGSCPVRSGTGDQSCSLGSPF